MDFRRQVPLDMARQLRFNSSDHPTLCFRTKNPNKLDPQTLRAIRELTPESAALLDELL
jgi:hypothetical protein